MGKWTLIILLAFGITSCSIRTASLRAQLDKRLVQLDKEKDKLKRQTDPVDRAKTGIKISEILLTLVSDAVRRGDIELMESRLEDYVDAIQEAHQTMMKTGRDAHKRPKGFKDLEIALRRQDRQLDDLAKELSLDQREPVEKARKLASDIRDELLRALFGEANAPRKG